MPNVETYFDTVRNDVVPPGSSVYVSQYQAAWLKRLVPLVKLQGGEFLKKRKALLEGVFRKIGIDHMPLGSEKGQPAVNAPPPSCLQGVSDSGFRGWFSHKTEVD